MPTSRGLKVEQYPLLEELGVTYVFLTCFQAQVVKSLTLFYAQVVKHWAPFLMRSEEVKEKPTFNLLLHACIELVNLHPDFGGELLCGGKETKKVLKIRRKQQQVLGESSFGWQLRREWKFLSYCFLVVTTVFLGLFKGKSISFELCKFCGQSFGVRIAILDILLTYRLDDIEYIRKDEQNKP
ncbi:hypothetical protein F8388_022502 [Cannabis sativa]|uniref:Uncharacterized protein n=1 Tax=Cannabis sativa TaxID=3483 RepID=A0A7J6EWW7_CANSA|nr:hypothetical protein F8388_022502 [Cannabis sativa]